MKPCEDFSFALDIDLVSQTPKWVQCMTLACSRSTRCPIASRPLTLLASLDPCGSFGCAEVFIPFHCSFVYRERPLEAVIILRDFAFDDVKEVIDVLCGGDEEFFSLVHPYAAKEDVHGLFEAPVANMISERRTRLLCVLSTWHRARGHGVQGETARGRLQFARL